MRPAREGGRRSCHEESRPALRRAPTLGGALPNTIYLGYGAQRLMLQGEATSGVGGYTYTWAPATGLSSTLGSTVTAKPAVTTTYTVTAIDSNGCTAAKSNVTVNVLDVRSGTKKDNVTVYHNGREISISASAVPAHLAHRKDQLGSCKKGLHRGVDNAALSQVPVLEAYPHSLHKTAIVKFRQVTTVPTQLRVYDAKGNVVAVFFDRVAEAGHEYPLVLYAEGLAPGLYHCRYESLGPVLTHGLSILK